jgi:hypothetical protein
MRKVKVVGAILCILLAILVVWQVKKHFTEKKIRPPVSEPVIEPSIRKPSDNITASCDISLQKNVYKPQRLILKEKCITITGIIQDKKREKDGDWHLQIKLDPQFEHLLNEVNIRRQRGALVAEPICQSRITQRSVGISCEGFNGHLFPIPKRNTRVKITGDYVLDTEHGWMEIHPVSNIEIIQ